MYQVPQSIEETTYKFYDIKIFCMAKKKCSEQIQKVNSTQGENYNR